MCRKRKKIPAVVRPCHEVADQHQFLLPPLLDFSYLMVQTAKNSKYRLKIHHPFRHKPCKQWDGESHTAHFACGKTNIEQLHVQSHASMNMLLMFTTNQCGHAHHHSADRVIQHIYNFRVALSVHPRGSVHTVMPYSFPCRRSPKTTSPANTTSTMTQVGQFARIVWSRFELLRS